MTRPSSVARAPAPAWRSPPAGPGVALALFARELLRLQAALQVEGLVRATFALIRRALPVHFQCLTLWPDREQTHTPFRDAYPLRTAAEAARFAALYPLARVVRDNPRLRVIRQTDFTSLARVRQTPFYRAYMVPEGWRYHCVLPFWADGKILGLLGLHRRADQGDFLRSEVRLLEEVHPYLAAAVERVHRLDQERARRATAESMLARLPWPVLVADWNLGVRFANPAAARLCARAEFGPEADQCKLPPGLSLPGSVAVECRRLRSAPRPGDDPPDTGSAEVLMGDGERWRAQISLDGRTGSALNEPVYLIHFAPASRGAVPVAGSGATRLPQLASLTGSEQAVALLVREGLSNGDVARRLGKSAHTVAKQLQAIYGKLRVRGRTHLAAVLH